MTEKFKKYHRLRVIFHYIALTFGCGAVILWLLYLEKYVTLMWPVIANLFQFTFLFFFEKYRKKEMKELDNC